MSLNSPLTRYQQISPKVVRVLGQIGQRERVVRRVDKVQILGVLLGAAGQRAVKVHLELLAGARHQVHIFRGPRDAPFELFACGSVDDDGVRKSIIVCRKAGCNLAMEHTRKGEKKGRMILVLVITLIRDRFICCNVNDTKKHEGNLKNIISKQDNNSFL